MTSSAGPARSASSVGSPIALLIRRRMRRVLAARAEVVTVRAEALARAPAVVATALVRDGRLLVAQRTRPVELAGRWELPGGRVEPGEDESAAVVRECREELGTDVIPDGRVGTDLPIDIGVLRVHHARPAPGAAEPRALEHAAVRWVDAAEVAGVDWVDADRAVIVDLVRLLTDAARRLRRCRLALTKAVDSRSGGRAGTELRRRPSRTA